MAIRLLLQELGKMYSGAGGARRLLNYSGLLTINPLQHSNILTLPLKREEAIVPVA